MLLLNNVTTADDYSSASTLGPVATTEKIVYVVANQPVLCQVTTWRPDKVEGTWSDEILVTPQTAEFQRVTGIRFRSALAGKPAQVIAQLIEPGDAIPVGGTPFTAALAASGGLTPGNVSLQFQKDGVLVATEPVLNFLTTLGLAVMADDPANSRVNMTLPLGCARLADAALAVSGTVAFTSIPQTYKHLFCVWSCAANGAAETNLQINCNADLGNNYDYNIMEVLNGVANNGRGLTQPATIIGITGTTSSLYKGIFFLPDYLNTLSGKSMVGLSTGTAVNFRVSVYGGKWGGTAALNRIDLTAGGGNFLNGSRFTLYGLA